MSRVKIPIVKPEVTGASGCCSVPKNNLNFHITVIVDTNVLHTVNVHCPKGNQFSAIEHEM